MNEHVKTFLYTFGILFSMLLFILIPMMLTPIGGIFFAGLMINFIPIILSISCVALAVTLISYLIKKYVRSRPTDTAKTHSMARIVVWSFISLLVLLILFLQNI